MHTRLRWLPLAILLTGPAAGEGQDRPIVPVVHLDEVPATLRPGHEVFTMLGPRQGTTGGFNSLVGVYQSLDFVITGTHADQEMFFVIEGTGTALVGTEEIPIRPGSCWVVKPGQVHGIKRDPASPHVKAFVVHGAP